MSAPSGLFIAIEGIDGSGTTTQTRLLADELQRTNPDREILVTREPSNTVVTNLIRQWISHDDPGMPAQALCLAFVLDRYLHLRDIVTPALERNAIVVTDRYKLSTLAYQVQDLPKEWVLSLTHDHRDPDYYVLIDVPVEQAVARVQSRGTTLDRYEASVSFQRKVAESYRWALEESEVPSEHLKTAGMDVIAVHREVRKAVWNALQV